MKNRSYSWTFWPAPDPDVIGENVYSWGFFLRFNLPVVLALLGIFTLDPVSTWTGCDPRILLAGVVIQMGTFGAVIAYGYKRVPVALREVATHTANVLGAAMLPLSTDQPLFMLWVVFLAMATWDAIGNVKSAANFLVTLAIPFVSLMGHWGEPHFDEKFGMAAVVSVLAGVIYMIATYITGWIHDGAMAKVDRARELGAREERVRLGHHLDATLGAALSEIALWHEVAVASEVEGAQSAPLAKARAKAREALQELRDLSAGIDARPANMAGLAGEIQRRAGQLCRDAGVAFDFQIGMLGDLSLADAYNASMIAIEAVENAIAHAKPTRVTVMLSGSPLGVTVEDDGVGFDPASVNHGRGLRNLAALAAALNAPLELESKPGAGTRVRVFSARG